MKKGTKQSYFSRVPYNVSRGEYLNIAKVLLKSNQPCSHKLICIHDKFAENFKQSPGTRPSTVIDPRILTSDPTLPLYFARLRKTENNRREGEACHPSSGGNPPHFNPLIPRTRSPNEKSDCRIPG
ncbi:hypothetical protein NPIL_178911 [Nephila pilipes]|uniref:Uncharacterized protein n=1 Tax=Nephila pilipes TaxID=299642 RepID=A0A8X6TE94_NEPPI|nr:hypothetical protein NPIL_178911 [Nephila pilipes]